MSVTQNRTYRRHAVERAAFETDLRGWHFESDPLTGGGKRAHVAAAHGSVRAPRNNVCAPVGAVLPTAVVPLQHDFRRHVRGVEVNISHQTLAVTYRQAARRIVEVVLM